MQRPASIHNEEHWGFLRQNIVAAAQAVLDGKLGIIEGAGKLAKFRINAKAEKDPDFIFLLGVDSETDHLPIGNAARHWNASVLKEKAKEIERVEGHYTERVFQACRSLIQKYQ